MLKSTDNDSFPLKNGVIWRKHAFFVSIIITLSSILKKGECMRNIEEVVYEGKLYTVYFKYDSGYLEIKEQENTSSMINNIKLVHENEVIYKRKPLPSYGFEWTRSISKIKCS
ncbi:hypothetical protein [Neobacillus sp. D3-1R]|uniref:hypothetical protein n=1 Tax=Neobacillus sp. D3-1R TaxID=3445778 RepID=UPI003FA0831C